jgi:hypothetical protein
MGALMTDNSNTTGNSKTMPIGRPHNLRMLLLSMVILVAGIVIGSAGTTLIIQKSSRNHEPRPVDAERMIHRLRNRLDLTDEQHDKIEPIIKTFMDKHRVIKEKARPQVEELVNNMKEDISALLTEDQKQRWEKQMKYFERGFRMQRGPGRGRGPGDGRGGPRGPRGGQGGGRGFGPGGEGRRPRRGPGPDGEMWRQRQPENPDFHRPPLPAIQDPNTTQ